MFNKTVFALCAILLLLPQSQGIDLTPSRLGVSRGDLEKRSAPQRRSWWTWSSQDGYQSGPSDPSSSYSNPENEAYENADPYKSASSTPQGYSYGRRNLTAGYNSGHVPTKDSEIKEWLRYHNHFRALYGASPLTWNPKLVQASKRLVDTCVWKHTQNNRYGENMSAGQSSIREVVEGWVNGPDEKNAYTSESIPSHFTQVVWISTSQVGCYHSTCRDVRGANLPQSPVTFWACNYNPPGNVIGEFAQNVKAAAGGRPI